MNKDIDHERLLQMLADEFPEVPEIFDENEKGLLHLEMAAFARLTEEAMDAGRFDQVGKYFHFVETVRERSTPDVENAIDVSYLEHLAFGELTEDRHRAMTRMGMSLKAIVLEIDGRGRWA